MLTYPNFSPIAFQWGFITVHWYGLMYVFGIGLAWYLAGRRSRRAHPPMWTDQQIEDMILYAAVGLLLGGRLGYLIFYQMPYFLHHPNVVWRIWEGGMSFHGGLIGGMIGLWLFTRQHACHFFSVTDFLAPLVPIGLAAGRLGNFINGELWGRVTQVPWGMVFPHAGPLPRHPSQLYELALEGVVLGVVLHYYAKRHPPLRCVSGVFLLGYAAGRIISECFRMPDPQYGFIAWHWLTMGQLLTLPLGVLGLYLWGYGRWMHPVDAGGQRAAFSSPSSASSSGKVKSSLSKVT